MYSPQMLPLWLCHDGTWHTHMAYSYLSYEGDVFCLTSPSVLVVRHMLSELTSLIIMPKDYQLWNFFKLFFLLIFSLNTASEIIRKYGKEKCYWGPWISQEKWQKH